MLITCPEEYGIVRVLRASQGVLGRTIIRLFPPEGSLQHQHLQEGYHVGDLYIHCVAAYTFKMSHDC
jgi:hypothetical protein